MLLQAILIGIFCYLGALSVPWVFGLTGGWYTLSRPLVSGMIVGIILGDVTTGIIIGVAVQAVYIAIITPGGTMPADLNFVAYPAIALGILSGADTEVAVTLAATIGILGTVIHNFMMILNSYWNSLSDKAAEAGNTRKLYFTHAIYPQVTTFLMRFVPTTVTVYLGARYMEGLINATPQTVIDIMTIVGGILPAVGIAILLKQLVKKSTMFIYFMAGFIAMVFSDINMIGLAVMAALIAFITYQSKQQEEEVL